MHKKFCWIRPLGSISSLFYFSASRLMLIFLAHSVEHMAKSSAQKYHKFVWQLLKLMHRNGWWNRIIETENLQAQKMDINSSWWVQPLVFFQHLPWTKGQITDAFLLWSSGNSLDDLSGCFLILESLLKISLNHKLWRFFRGASNYRYKYH